MLKKLFIVILIFNLFAINAQQKVQLSNFSQISIITSGPGENLYEKFGHSAIRVKDPMLQLDLIYNYGMFDFNAPNFILNFIKGYMKYQLARYPFHYAFKSAQKDGRWMRQQVLNLTIQEKNALFNFLEINAQPKNASYFYDPFFDNCATRPRDILNTILKDKITWNTSYTSNASLRKLMNAEIHQNTWGSVGINIALGNKLDKKALPSEYLYLPDYVEKALELATIQKNEKQEKLISKTEILLDFDEKPSKSDAVSPFLVFNLLLLIVSYLTFLNYQKQSRNKWLDFSIFFITGFSGFLFLFLWFFTNHSTAPNNFNLLWAFPPNLIIAFYLLKDKTQKWIKKYISFLLIIHLLIALIWILEIQLFNWTLIPFFALLLVRYLFLQKTLNG